VKHGSQETGKESRQKAQEEVEQNQTKRPSQLQIFRQPARAASFL
jgi:hypothetical protein